MRTLTFASRVSAVEALGKADGRDLRSLSNVVEHVEKVKLGERSALAFHLD